MNRSQLRGIGKKFIAGIMITAALAVAGCAGRVPLAINIWQPDGEKEVVGLRMNLPLGRDASVSGLDAGVYLVNYDMRGVQIGGLISGAEDMRGVQIGGLLSGAEDMTGVQIGGVVCFAGGDMTGLQASTSLSFARKNRGLQLSVVNIPLLYLSQHAFDLTSSSLLLGNFAETSSGVQMSVVNTALISRGLQIGLLNIAELDGGLQIGLLNIGANGILPIFPFINYGRR